MRAIRRRARGPCWALFDCRKHTVRRFAQMKGKPGDVTAITETSIFINAHGGQIEVLRVRADGGKKIGAGEFARAMRLATIAA